MGPAQVANQDSGSAGVASFGKPHHLTGQLPLVESVGNQYQIGAGSWEVVLVQDVSADGQDRYVVGSSVHADSYGSDRVDVICGYGGCAGLGSCNCPPPPAGGKVACGPASDSLPLVPKAP